MSLEDEVGRARERAQEAMDAQASRGSTLDGIHEAGLRAAFGFAVDGMDPDLGRLEAALGTGLDAGGFVVGVQAAACASEGIDLLAMAAHRVAGPLLREFVAEARRRHAAEPSADDFKDRLRLEAAELAERVRKLGGFLETPPFDALPADERQRLRVQHEHMGDYLEVLRLRCEALGVAL